MEFEKVRLLPAAGITAGGLVRSTEYCVCRSRYLKEAWAEIRSKPPAARALG